MIDIAVGGKTKKFILGRAIIVKSSVVPSGSIASFVFIFLFSFLLIVFPIFYGPVERNPFTTPSKVVILLL